MNPIPNDDRPTDRGQTSASRGTDASDPRPPVDDRLLSPITATGGEGE